MLNLKKTEIEIKDKLVTIWLNQPEIHNALNITIIKELIKIFKWIREQKEIMVILIRGRGNSFCTGADIKWMLNSGLLEYQNCYRDSKKLATCFKLIYQSDKVVINLVHGDAFGGALGFLGAGDFTLALKNTRFRLPELRLGLVPSVILPYLLTRVKPAYIKYQIFSAGIFTAEEALKIGFIDKVCEDIDDMELKVNELIQNIYPASPQALKEAKHLLRALNKSRINSDNIKKTVKIITRMKMSDDARDRMSKFLSKK
jgi:methylglutaconyl-CoA hydratase